MWHYTYSYTCINKPIETNFKYVKLSMLIIVVFIDFSCGRIITVIRSLYSCLRSCVKVPEGLTEFFRCTVGTKQGCMISPCLFALCANELVCLLDELDCPGMCIDEAFSNVNLIMYADNIDLMNDTIGRLQNSIEILNTFCNKYRSKTNVIIFRNGGRIRHNVFHRGDPILCVTYYKYLGVMFSSRLCWTYLTDATGAQLVPMGHSRSVHMYLRGHARHISARVCVIGIHIDIGGSMGLSVLCATTCVSVCNSVPMGKDHFRGAPPCANKWPDRWLIQRDISVVLLRTVISTTIGASDQDYPMSTGGGKT